MKRLLALLLVVTAFGCSPKHHAQKDEELDDGHYSFRQPGEKYRRVYVYTKDDSAAIFTNKEGSQVVTPDSMKDQFLVKHSFDIDAITIPFKYRPAMSNHPRQFTADFNGDFFVGYRVDRFRIVHEKTPVGIKRYKTHTGLAFGAFTGISATAVNGFNTDGLVADDYTGLGFSRGFALILGLDHVTVGAAVGWDRLTDRDKNIWIHQDKPWYGFTIGLDLN